MSKTRTMLAVAAATAAQSTAACGSSPPRTAPEPGQWRAGSPASQHVVPATTAPAEQDDPNGLQCVALDSLGYCPGDDPSPASPMDNWCNGNGHGEFQSVESDLNQLSSDTGNNDRISAESDGAALFCDAAVAGHDLPPGTNPQKLHYGHYTGFLLAGGEKLSMGDVSGATDSFTKSTPDEYQVMNLTNQCS